LNKDIEFVPFHIKSDRPEDEKKNTTCPLFLSLIESEMIASDITIPSSGLNLQALRPEIDVSCVSVEGEG
jgi:hypothetical protein